jgi:hypothetical protein
VTNFVLGRIGLDADIDDVSVWDANGETVTVAFSTPPVGDGGSVLRANAYRQMLLGYLESPDQRFVPVQWADDTTVDGYYRVVAAQVTPDPDLAFDGLYYFSATLHRVAGYAQPAIQTTYQYFTRSSVHSVTPVAYLGTPNAGTQWSYAYEPEDGTYSNQSPAHSYFTEEGASVGAVTASITGGSGPAAGEIALWVRSVDPWAYYYGSARLEINGYPVEGRQIPATWYSENWRLTNGNIELTMDVNRGNDEMTFQMRAWNGAVWANPIPITLLGDNSPTTPRDAFKGPDTMTILRNTAEEVIIRIGMHVGTNQASWPVFLDIGVRRGARTFTCRMRRASGTGDANPGIDVANHLSAYGWRREGAWVSAGTLVEEQYMWNPRALVDATNWDRYNATGTATGRITGVTGLSIGSTAYRVTASAAHATTSFGVEHGLTGSATPNGGLSAGSAYSFAAYVRCSVSRTLTFTVTFRNSSGATISSVSQDVAVTANTWARVTLLNQVSPAGTARVSVRVSGNAAGGAWAAGNTLDMSGVQAELGSTIDAYWDGDDPASDLTIYTYSYHDAPNTSSIKWTRSALPTYWFVSPTIMEQGSDGWYPLPDVDPSSWDFGFGMVAAGITGDAGRYLREVQSYNVSITQTDDVVAV